MSTFSENYTHEKDQVYDLSYQKDSSDTDAIQ